MGSITLDVKQRISCRQDADSLTCSAHILLCTEPGNSSPSYTTLKEFQIFVLSKWLWFLYLFFFPRVCSSELLTERPNSRVVICNILIKLLGSGCCQLNCDRLPENPLFLKQEKFRMVTPFSRPSSCESRPQPTSRVTKPLWQRVLTTSIIIIKLQAP